MCRTNIITQQILELQYNSLLCTLFDVNKRYKLNSVEFTAITLVLYYIYWDKYIFSPRKYADVCF